MKRKLRLKRETLRRLTKPELARAQGGHIPAPQPSIQAPCPDPWPPSAIDSCFNCPSDPWIKCPVPVPEPEPDSVWCPIPDPNP